MLRVKCVLSDCVYYNKPSDPRAGEEACDCAHPEKTLSLAAEVCPLYKKDWQKMNGQMALIKAMKRKR